MPNSRRIGYGFECRVRRNIENMGVLVFRQGKSRFPDLICIVKEAHDSKRIKIDHEIRICNETMGGGIAFFVECKVNKYLSAEEKVRAKEMAEHALFFVAYRIKKGSKKLGFYQIRGGE